MEKHSDRRKRKLEDELTMMEGTEQKRCKAPMSESERDKNKFKHFKINSLLLSKEPATALGRIVVRRKVPLVRGWEKLLVKNLGAAQNHLPDLKMHGRTANALPNCWERKLCSGATSDIWFG